MSNTLDAMIRLFDIRDVGTVQRLSPVGRTLAYEPAAVDGLNPLREAMRAYVAGGYDRAVALMRRDPDNRELDTFGLMYLVPGRVSTQNEARFAALAYMAPFPQTDELTNTWVELTEAFVSYAGEHGVHCIVAEIPETGREAQAFHQVGFTSLMHQDIMKLAMLPEVMETPDVIGLRPVEDKDDAYIKLLSMRVVPKLVQKAEGSTDLTRLTHRSDCGFILMHQQEPMVYISLQQGRRGYGMQILFKPEAEDLAESVLRYSLVNLCGRSRRPVYCMVPTYQSWLLPVLDAIGFTHITSNAIMVKHTTARVRQPVWSLQPSSTHTKLINGDIKFHPRKTNIRLQK
jgi:hypothetical protein